MDDPKSRHKFADAIFDEEKDVALPEMVYVLGV